MFLVCVGGCSSSSANPVYNTHTHTHTPSTRSCCSLIGAQQQTKDFPSKYPQDVDLSIFPPTRPWPATVTLSASSKYSRTVMCFTVWFSSTIKYTYSVFNSGGGKKKKSKFVPYVGHMTQSVCVCLHLCVCIDLRETDNSAAVMETCISILSLLKTTGSSMQLRGGYWLFSSSLCAAVCWCRAVSPESQWIWEGPLKMHIVGNWKQRDFLFHGLS